MAADIDVQTHFRKRLRAEREARKWSQSELAKALTDNGNAMHATTIAKIEAGDRAVRIDEAVAIAVALDVELWDLLPDDPNPPASLRRARRWADSAMDRTRNAALDLVLSYQRIVELLGEHPDLFDYFDDDELAAPETVDEYLDWAQKRTRRLFASPDEDEHIEVDGIDRCTQLLAIVEAALDNLVLDVPEHQQIERSKQGHPANLGRGVAGLILTQSEGRIPNEEPTA